MSKKFRPMEEDSSPTALKALDAMGLSPMPTQPLLPVGAAPVGKSGAQGTKCGCDQLKEKLLAMENEANEAARLCADLPALDDETLSGNIRYLRTQLKELALENAQLRANLSSDTAYDTANKLANRLATANNLNAELGRSLAAADEANAAHHKQYAELATEHERLKANLKDFQSIVRAHCSSLEREAAGHDPSIWIPAAERREESR